MVQWDQVAHHFWCLSIVSFSPYVCLFVSDVPSFLYPIGISGSGSTALKKKKKQEPVI